MYPGPDVLQEVGRVTIAGSRLDVQMGFLWHHLDRSIDVEVARQASGSKQCREVRRLAQTRLTGDLRKQVLAAVDVAEDARRLRNEVVHQDWLLRGVDAMRPVADLGQIAPEDLPAYLREWERESRVSDEWLRVPAKSVDVLPAQPLEELVQVEGALAAATDRVTSLTFIVASARETGEPPGYVHPS